MQCPLCKIEAAISGSEYVLSGEKKLFIKQDMKCRNPSCSNYGKTIFTIKNELPVSKDTVETQ